MQTKTFILYAFDSTKSATYYVYIYNILRLE